MSDFQSIPLRVFAKKRSPHVCALTLLTAGLAATGLTAIAPQAHAADSAPTLRISTAYDTSSGKYGTGQETTITSIPVVLAYDTGPLTFKLAVPYLRVSGSTNVIPGVGRVRNLATSNSASGMGDTVASAIYNVYNNSAMQLGVDVTGKVKFATADESKGLGTGENDYGVQVDVYRKIQRVTWFGGMGYTKLGSSPALPLNNVFNATVGGSYQLASATQAGAALDYRQKASAFGFEQRELMGYVSHKFDRNWKGQLYVLKGFSDGSPDWGAGLSVGYSF